MKATSVFFIALVIGFCASLGIAGDGLDLAKKYVEFWQPIEGSWEVMSEIDENGPINGAGTVVWTFAKSPTGVCYLGDSRVNGKIAGHSIHAYDPEHNCWHFVTYGIPQRDDDPLLGTAWVLVDLAKEKHLTEGVTFIVEGKDVMEDGTVVNRRTRWTWSKLQADTMEVLLSEGTRNGEPVPNSKLVLKRTK